MKIPSRVIDRPIDRFRIIYRELIAPELQFDPSAQRFAAAVGLLTPGDPLAVAKLIRASAEGMRAHSHWWQMMNSPLRYVIAAMETMTGDDPAAFERELHRLHGVFRARHIPHGGIYEVMAVVLLRLGAHGEAVTDERLDRAHAIYREFKRYHWWLTGPHDLPASVVLSELPGEPAAIGQLVEDIYQGLREQGFSIGIHLETVAHILALADLPAAAAVARYRDLSRRLTIAGEIAGPIGYGAIGVASLLDVPVERMVHTLLEQQRELRNIHPVLHQQIELDIAADLAFFSLLQDDARLAGGDPQARRRVVRVGVQAAAVVACFGAISIDPNLC